MEKDEEETKRRKSTLRNTKTRETGEKGIQNTNRRTIINKR